LGDASFTRRASTDFAPRRNAVGTRTLLATLFWSLLAPP
jgi:hypothetical protein